MHIYQEAHQAHHHHQQLYQVFQFQFHAIHQSQTQEQESQHTESHHFHAWYQTAIDVVCACVHHASHHFQYSIQSFHEQFIISQKLVESLYECESTSRSVVSIIHSLMNVQETLIFAHQLQEKLTVAHEQIVRFENWYCCQAFKIVFSDITKSQSLQSQ